MRYEKQILEAYQRVGFTPRERQVEHVNKICVAFLDDKFKNVILSAPTGTGKSIIGAVASDVVHQVKYPGEPAGASFLLTATNVLADQYHNTFGDRDSDQFVVIKGANNYECTALSTPEEPAFGDSCAIQLFKKTGMDDIIESNCKMCEYRLSRARRPHARHLITNYAYYFVDRMYASHPMPKRTVSVFDEAHLLNDLFTEHNAIYFSEKRLHSFTEEISEALDLGNTNVFKVIKHIKDSMLAKKITDDTYREYLKSLHEVYNIVSQSAAIKAEKNVRSHSTYLKLSRMSKKYKNLGCKIDDLFLFEYQHVFEHKPKDVKKGQREDEVSVKPIFVGEMFEALDNADHNLLMSATISQLYAGRTMTLPETTKHIRLEPQFPQKNKKVVFFKPQSLNYNTMKDPATLKKLCATSQQIVEHHTLKGERGIILAPSFNIVQSVAETLRKASSKYRVFEHVRGEKLADWLEEFKAYQGGPAVLLTPSGFEGVDLPGDLSRYQIIVKAPFASLGDKRIKTILDLYPDIYSLTTLMKVTQGAGRSVRSAEDYATTYMLDTGIQRLWNSNNEWKDEFLTTYTSSLEDE